MKIEKCINNNNRLQAESIELLEFNRSSIGLKRTKNLFRIKPKLVSLASAILNGQSQTNSRKSFTK